jgi:dUTP pyrophosphatase
MKMHYKEQMKVKIKRIDKSLPLPIYETGGSVGFDIMARTDFEILPKNIVLVPSNLIIGVPEKYMLVVASRSSTALKKGLQPANGFGVIDHDFCGPNDEIKVIVYNFTDNIVFVKKGEKIAQGVFVRIDKFEWEEVDEIKKESRGGIGSTGGYM